MNEVAPPLKLHVLDVGHGDCLVVEFPDGISHGIVDCNRHKESNRGFGREYDPNEPKALTYFRNVVANGLKPVVEFVCLTHPHLDHYRGLGQMLEGLMGLDIPIREFWDFGVSAKKARAIMRLADTPTFREHKDEMLRLLRAKYELIQNGTGQRIMVNPTRGLWKKDGVEIDLLAPHANQFEVYSNYLGCETTKQRQDYRRHLKLRRCLTDQRQPCLCPVEDNIISSALLLRYGSFRLILAGDITNCSWRGILARAHEIDPQCHCVKVSHHGSLEGNFPYQEEILLWEHIRVQGADMIAAISGGYRDGLPHDDTIRTLGRSGYEIYCTGPRVTVGLKPYRAPYRVDPSVRFFLEKTCFVETGRMPITGAQSRAQAHGDIKIECFANGNSRVSVKGRADVALS
jgi:beta-lactamase superfamily II metal-dependent hydrolase